MLRKKFAPCWWVVSFPEGPAIVLGDLPHLLTLLLLGLVVTAPTHPIQPAQGPLREKQHVCDLKEVQGEVMVSSCDLLTASHQGIVVLDQWLIVLPLELALQEGFGLYHSLSMSSLLDPGKFWRGHCGKKEDIQKAQQSRPGDDDQAKWESW